MNRPADGWRDWRRRIKARAPYVRRREHELLQRRCEALLAALHGTLPLASQAPLRVVAPLAPALRGEVCLYVTHATQPRLKSHVLHHLAHLQRAGIAVVLVVNTDLPLDAVDVPADVARGCAGVLVRANAGFDFAAWAHAWQLADRSGWQRLYLVNDSIVGPLDAAAFDTVLARVRASTADLVGLTVASQPSPHVQSYFLVLGAALLRSPWLDRLFAQMPSFATKLQVIDAYETQLTRLVTGAGGRVEALYADAGPIERQGLDGQSRLQAAGFPYAKTSLLRGHAGQPAVARLRELGQVDDQV